MTASCCAYRDQRPRDAGEAADRDRIARRDAPQPRPRRKASITHLIGDAVVGALVSAWRRTTPTPRPTASGAGPSPSTSTWAWPSTPARPTGTASRWCRTSRRPRRRTSTSPAWLTRTWSARPGPEAAVDDFAGTMMSPTNLHARHRALGARRLTPGEGAIVGVGATEHRRLPGRVRGDHGPAGHRQDHHADLDLRRLHHPGRAVRPLPAVYRYRRRRCEDVSTTACRRAAHPERADPRSRRSRLATTR